MYCNTDGLAGLAILTSLHLTFVVYEFVAYSVYVDAQMISVERILKYIDSIEHEPSHNGQDEDARCADQHIVRDTVLLMAGCILNLTCMITRKARDQYHESNDKRPKFFFQAHIHSLPASLGTGTGLCWTMPGRVTERSPSATPTSSIGRTCRRPSGE